VITPNAFKNLPRDRDFLPPRVNVDNSIEFERPAHFELPIPPDGFTRDSNNPYRFIPNWKPCDKRLHGVRGRPCGNVVLTSICRNEQAETFNTMVKHSICETCPMRSINNEE
jgi:hypothetical protein